MVMVNDDESCTILSVKNQKQYNKYKLVTVESYVIS